MINLIGIYVKFDREEIKRNEENEKRESMRQRIQLKRKMIEEQKTMTIKSARSSDLISKSDPKKSSQISVTL